MSLEVKEIQEAFLIPTSQNDQVAENLSGTVMFCEMRVLETFMICASFAVDTPPGFRATKIVYHRIVK
jgi:hypothetical protein